MEQIEKLETTISGWFKDLPRMPKNITSWLADNIWWLTIVGVVLSVFAVLSALSLVLWVLGISGIAASSIPAAYGGYAAGAAISVSLVSVLVSIIGFIFTTILMILAISPLKEKKKKGWTLLFAVLLINFAFSAVGNIVGFNVVGLFFTVLWAAVEAYVLFEIRGYFGVKSKQASKKVEAKA